MRTIGLFAGHCNDLQLIRATLRMLVACLATDSKQVNDIHASNLYTYFLLLVYLKFHCL